MRCADFDDCVLSFSPQSVGVEYFQRACVAEYCHSLSQSDPSTGGYTVQTPQNAANTAICATVAAFAAECARVTSQALSWRSEEFCRKYQVIFQLQYPARWPVTRLSLCICAMVFMLTSCCCCIVVLYNL